MRGGRPPGSKNKKKGTSFKKPSASKRYAEWRQSQDAEDFLENEAKRKKLQR